MRLHCLSQIMVAIVAITVMGGCAIDKVEPRHSIIIPPAPEEPRLVFIDTYRGESTFVQGPNSLDVLIGDTQIDVGKNIKKPYGVGGFGGRIYVADTGSASVFVIDPKKKKVSLIGDQPVGKLVMPVDVAFSKDGTLYVSDTVLKRVHSYDQNGTFKSAYGMKDEFYRPSGISVNSDLGLLYVVDTLAHNIKVFSLAGQLVSTIGKRGDGDGEFNYPTNIAIDNRNGNVIVCDTQNFRIQILDKDGKFLGKFGEVGDKAGMFARPKGVGVDSDGHIYVVDAAFNNVQVFNDKGELLLFFGTPGTGPVQFQLPAGLSFDEHDRLIIAEVFSGRVQVFQYISEKWKKENPNEYQKLKQQ